MNSQTAGCIAAGLGQEHPAVGGDGGSCRRGRARARWPRHHPGWTALETWASCSGSPSRITFWADLDAATASASASCPASSMTSTSTGASRICGEAKNQEVPATRLYLALAAAALEPWVFDSRQRSDL